MANEASAIDRVEFATTCFCPALHGAEVARANEALGYDVQLFGENHNMAADIRAHTDPERWPCHLRRGAR